MTCYLKARGQSKKIKKMNAPRWNRRGGRFEIERQYLAYQVRCIQVRCILKTKKLSEVEIEALREKVRTSPS